MLDFMMMIFFSKLGVSSIRPTPAVALPVYQRGASAEELDEQSIRKTRSSTLKSAARWRPSLPTIPEDSVLSAVLMVYRDGVAEEVMEWKQSVGRMRSSKSKVSNGAPSTVKKSGEKKLEKKTSRRREATELITFN